MQGTFQNASVQEQDFQFVESDLWPEEGSMDTTIVIFTLEKNEPFYINLHKDNKLQSLEHDYSDQETLQEEFGNIDHSGFNAECAYEFDDYLASESRKAARELNNTNDVISALSKSTAPRYKTDDNNLIYSDTNSKLYQDIAEFIEEAFADHQDQRIVAFIIPNKELLIGSAQNANPLGIQYYERGQLPPEQFAKSLSGQVNNFYDAFHEYGELIESYQKERHSEEAAQALSQTELRKEVQQDFFAHLDQPE